jgi:tetratricopeptide (TPR) repeat protein
VPLTNKQKKYITGNRKKSPKDIAKKLNLTVEEVKSFIETIPQKTYPKWFYLIPIAIPVILVLLLEVILVVSDYGYNLDQWDKGTSTHYMLNQEIAYRYFYNLKSVPMSSSDLFDIEKSDNSFRVFVLGGSSAAGYPFTPSGSFAKYIRKRLTLLYPDSKIEVVNLAFPAINSYTIRDILPGVLEQKPDLLLFYAGHNEYYGALGAGSMESLGNNRGLVNFVLSINKYKTVQFLRDVIKWIYGTFSSDDKRSGTLMSRMAKEQSIALGSDVYNAGIEQFEGNLTDIFAMIKNYNIPIIVSDLTSNIKDQKPFISMKEADKSADLVYSEAKNQYNNGNYISAKEKFVEAKDLDALRFRAPSDINVVIEKLAVEYGIPLISSDAAFAEMISDGIVGDELMTDHLHPKIIGYQIIGKLFFEKMLELNYLPSTSPSDLSLGEQDSLTTADYDFTDLDSRIAEYRLIILKSDWPYVDKPRSDKEVLKEFNMQTYGDSLAFKVVHDMMDWERAHRELANYHLARNNISGFMEEMDVVIDQYPLIVEYNKIAARELLNVKEYEKSYPYLQEYYSRDKDAFSSKWLGIIDLSKNKVKSAIKYLEESLIFNSGDAQVLFNLAGAYSMDKQYQKGLDTINRCLRMKPNFNGAKGLQSQLENILMNQNR